MDRMRIAAFLIATPLFAQPAFEVASIKLGTTNEVGGVYTYPGGRVGFRGCTVDQLIQQAFNIQKFQVSGGPEWMRTDRYDIDAKPADFAKSKESMPPYRKAPMNDEQRQMLQSLLVDRFDLRFHHETREGLVFLLEKGTKPLKWTDSKDKGEFPWAGIMADGLWGENENMPDLASRLSGMLARPVTDKTGIQGSFDFKIAYAPGDDHPDMIAEIQATIHDLGLKLEQSKGPIDVIVVESVAKPSEN
jgi:uncharacterized protein (TIGR03435 family)